MPRIRDNDQSTLNSIISYFPVLGKQLSFIFVFCFLSAILQGCSFKNKVDPFEGINRGVFVLNRAFDRVLLKPTARIYETVIPKFFRNRINDFFQNLTEIPTIANDILQADFASFKNDASRFALNTTWGLGGLFDVAACAGRKRHFNDFGQTLGKWGYKQSAYIVLPLFGPSTVRDAIGRAANYGMSVWPYIQSNEFGWGLYALFVIDSRAEYMKFEPVINEVAIDDYVFFRDAYLQRRAAEIRGCCATTEAVNLEGPPE